jgi:hypothetical protein
VWAEPTTIAVARGLLAAGTAGFKDGDAVPVAQQFRRAGGTDDAGAYDDDVHAVSAVRE